MIKVEHELHRRRLGRNLGVALSLLLFAGVVFGLTVVKVKRGEPLEGYDYVVRPSLLPKEDQN